MRRFLLRFPHRNTRRAICAGIMEAFSIKKTVAYVGYDAHAARMFRQEYCGQDRVPNRLFMSPSSEAFMGSRPEAVLFDCLPNQMYRMLGLESNGERPKQRKLSILDYVEYDALIVCMLEGSAVGPFRPGLNVNEVQEVVKTLMDDTNRGNTIDFVNLTVAPPVPDWRPTFPIPEDDYAK